MKSAWEQIPLVEICTSVEYGYTASAVAESVGPKFLRITDIVPSRLDWRTVPHCEIPEDKLDRYRLQDGDIVIARTGATVGYAKRIAGPPDAVFASYLVRIRASSSVDSSYIGLVVESDDYKRFVIANAGGAAQPNANAKVLTSYPVPLPPRDLQTKIAAFISTYDELIENNMRRIEILGEMAQAIYREWFVNLRFPGHEDVELVDSNTGPRPHGWSDGFFDDLARITRINVDPHKHPTESFDHFSFSAFDDKGLPEVNLGEELKAGKLLIENSSVLLAKLNPRIKRVWLAQTGSERRSIASSEFLVLSPKPPASLEYLYSLLNSDEFHSRLLGLAGGTSTSHQRVKPPDLQKLRLLIPAGEVVAAFTEALRPMLELANNLRVTNANLGTTRDLLLPKLISGEIDVSELDIDTSWLAA